MDKNNEIEDIEQTHILIASIKDAVDCERESIMKIEDENKRKEEITKLNELLTIQLEKMRVEVLIYRNSEKMNTEMRKVFKELEEAYKPMELK